MEKIRVALILSGFESFSDFYIIESLKEGIPGEKFDLKTFKVDTANVAKTVKEIEDFKPLFTVDFNTKGIIWGEREKEKKPLQDVLGTVHLTIFTEDPIFHGENLLNLRGSTNTVFLITDLRYGQFLASLGFANIFYFTPCVNLRLIPPKTEKDINLVFVGDAVEPAALIENWKQFMDKAVIDFAVEVGEFCFRNPEVSPLFAVEYILPLMNPQFQENFNKFRQENPAAYFAWLANVAIYTTARRNWFILSFLEGTDLTIVGRVEGTLPEGANIADIKTFEDRLAYINRAKIGLTAFPAFVPSGIGFTPLEIAACETAPMINFRSTLPSFFKPQEEIIVYNPLDRMDIEEKLLFYLENEEDRKIIAENAAKAVKDRFTCTDRVDFFKELMENIYQQIVQQKAAEQKQDKNRPNQPMN
jgi:hypothetical protein